MQITVYADIENEEIYTELEYETKLEQLVTQAVTESCLYCYSFAEWLDDFCCPSEVFMWSEEERQENIQQFREYARRTICANWDCIKRTLEI